MKRRLPMLALAAGLVAIAVIQFIPPAPLTLPAEAPPGERSAHRVLPFEGISNFRDLGGYTTVDGRRVRWGRLYRSGSLAQASPWDLEQLRRLDLALLVDFRSAEEKAEEPDRLPEEHRFQVLEIPTLDRGNEALLGGVRQGLEDGELEGFDPDAFMLNANRQFATEFTPQFRRFVHSVRDAGGQPVLWHCTAGKDRSGFAAAILLRLLGVPREQIMRDYLASHTLALEARSRDLTLLRLFKGREAADKVAVLMGVDGRWLDAAFAAIDQRWGSFDRYVREGLQLDAGDVRALQEQLLYRVK